MAGLQVPNYDPLRTGGSMAADRDEELAEVPGPVRGAPAPSRWLLFTRIAGAGLALTAVVAVSSTCFALIRHSFAGVAVDASHSSGLYSSSMHSAKASSYDDVSSMFAAVDQNKDATISQSEAIAFAISTGANVHEAKNMFKKLDVNGDGRLDKDEFLSEWRRQADSVVRMEGVQASALNSAMRSAIDHPFTKNAEVDPTAWDRIEQVDIEPDKFEKSVGATRTTDPVGTAAGAVSGLYTIGCPSTAYPPLRNRQRPDGCFPGVRAINERLQYQLLGGYIEAHDPVTFVADVVGYKHAWMPLMLVKSYDLQNPTMLKCEGESEEVKNNHSSTPEADPYSWLTGHNSDAYLTYIGQQSLDLMSITMAHFSAIAYNDDVGKVARAFMDNDWNLVGAAESKAIAIGERDMVFLAQEPKSLNCALVFRGTDSATDALVDINAKPAAFCGFADDDDLVRGDDKKWHPKAGNNIVHNGFKKEIMRIVESRSYIQNIKSKLPKCNKMYVAGHSLGGAVAELFTACVQRAPMEGNYGFEDYQAIGWKPEAPVLLDPITPAEAEGDIGSIEQGYHQCLADTGGTCRNAACNQGRGETDCVDGKCLCKPSFCAFGGVCVHKDVVNS